MNTTMIKSDTPAPAPLTVRVFTSPDVLATPRTNRHMRLREDFERADTEFCRTLERELTAAAEAADAYHDAGAGYLREREEARRELAALRAATHLHAGEIAAMTAIMDAEGWETHHAPDPGADASASLRQFTPSERLALAVGLIGRIVPDSGQPCARCGGGPWPPAAVDPAALDEHGGGPHE